jgi:UDP-glucose 4-epimerase
VDDVAPLMAEAIEVDAAWNQTFNIGSDRPYSLNELAALVASVMGVEPRVEHLPARLEVVHAYSSHARVREVFGDRPQTSLEEGLRRMASWVRTQGPQAATPFGAVEVEKNLPPAWRRL